MNENFQNIDDPVNRAIEMYKYYPSIILIHNNVDNQNKFSLKLIALSDIVKEIKDINPNKSSTKDSIPPKILKITSQATANKLQKLLDESLATNTFPDSFKLAVITPLDKTNYHPVSVLPIWSILFENILQKQVNGCISNCLSH